MNKQTDVIIDFRYVSWNKLLWKKFIRRISKMFSIKISENIGRLYINNTGGKSKFEIYVIASVVLSEVMDKYTTIPLNIIDYQISEMELPINEDVESNAYLFYCTRLAILNANRDLCDALLDSFLDIHLYYNPSNYNYLFFDEKMNDYLKLNFRNYEDINCEDGIINFIRKQILSGMYVNIHLDEYYIKQKDFYDNRHYIHENLIYGYNDKLQVFMAYGITKRQMVSCFIISYEEIAYAYEKAKLFYFCGAQYLDDPNYYPLLLLKPLQTLSYEFTETVMQDKIQQFLWPKFNEIVGKDYHVYGSHVYDSIIDDLTQKSDMNFVDYRVFHMLYEHKKCLQSRMEWLVKHGNMSSKGKEVYERMKTIVQEYNSIRLMYLDGIRKENKLYFSQKTLDNIDARFNIAEKLNDAQLREKVVLQKFIE